MTFVLGMVAGSLISFVVLVAFMAPKHWETYHENVDLRAALRNANERADHYKHMTKPTGWGPVEQREAGIQKKAPPYQGVTLEPGESIEFKFDDIRETP
mgnify:CR=1 FL=1